MICLSISRLLTLLRAALVPLFAYLLLIVASALLETAEFLHELAFISAIQCHLVLL